MRTYANRIRAKLENAQIVDRRRLYEIWEENHLLRLLQHFGVDCVLDIGANHGQYASKLRRNARFSGLIVSFEPTPEAADIVREKAAGDSQWVVEELAVSESNGEQVFNIMTDAQFSSLSQPKHDEVDGFKQSNLVKDSIVVRTQTLADVLERLATQYGFKAPFLKLDTQGMDVRIIKAAGRDILQKFIGIQSELAVKKIYADSVDFRDALTIYEQMGFELSALVPNNAGHFPRLIEFDCIMVRSDLMGLANLSQ
jgi:FkbM family methyltransferase